MKNLLLLLFCIFSLALKAQEKDSLQNSQVATPDIEEYEDMTFLMVEEQPIFPGCEGVTKDKRLECFNEKMHKHLRKHLRYPSNLGRMGIQEKVFVDFLITKEGQIIIKTIRTTKYEFRKEVIRIFKKLPKVIIPGKHHGKYVNVFYMFPINFKLQ